MGIHNTLIVVACTAGTQYQWLYMLQDTIKVSDLDIQCMQDVAFVRCNALK